ncbi:MAG TPA: hypothetical protein EYG38_01575, partial [Verrucomicrobia bacterium]|nr:hypothetical protein [Verrucomicrobiota bacterium]
AVPIHQEHSENFSGEHTLLLPHSTDPDSPSDPVAGAGTPAYMSPEQLEDGWTASPSADIYSLGAVLYKILTGLPLFETGDLSPAEIRSRIRSASFPKPSDRIKEVPKPLEAICLKAMEQNPSDRYKNALQLADDVEGYLGDEDIPVYRESFLEKNLRRLRRHQGIARSVGLFSVILVIVLTISSLSLGILANKERAAKLEADAANKASLKTAAKFASQTVALVIKERWRILKMEASDPELIRYLSDLNQAGTIPDWTHLYRWLLRAQSDNAVTQAESWFLCDATGKQLARFPNSEKTVGESFAHRDYFHGNGMDLPVGVIGKPSHITYPHLSAVYTSRNNQAMKVAFSIPIWSERNLTPNTTFLGVLGMSIKLGHFEILQQQLGNDQVAVLAQLGKDHIEQKDESLGLILHHPFLSDQHEKIQKGEISKPRLSPELVNLLNSLNPKGPGVIRSSYQDPVGGEYKGNWIAAAQRVYIEGWQGPHLDPNWVVLVQKRMPAD